MYRCVQAFLRCPLRISPGAGVYCQLTKGRRAHFALYRRPYHEGTNTYGQLTQLDSGAVYSQCIIGCGCDTYPTAYSFTLYAGNHKFWTFSNSVDNQSKATKEFQAIGFVINRNQLVKRGAGTEGLFSCTF